MTNTTRAYKPTTTIRVHYNAIDHFSQSRSFKTLAAARRYAQKWVGPHPDTTGWYAVSFDGVGRITANVPMTDLFPPETSEPVEAPTWTSANVQATYPGAERHTSRRPGAE
jgi:hypothetical protein